MAVDVLTAYAPDIHAPPSVSGNGGERFFVFGALGTAPRRLTGDTSLQFVSAAFYGYRSVDANGTPTANVADVLIGGVDSNGNEILPNTVTTGGQVIINAPIGKSFHLNDVWVKATNGSDGLVVELA